MASPRNGRIPRLRIPNTACTSSQGALAPEAAAEAEAAEAMPAGTGTGASIGVPGALATTDADGSDGSEAGVATGLAGAVVEKAGAASGARFEHADTAAHNTQAEIRKDVFTGGTPKSRRYFTTVVFAAYASDVVK